MCSCVYVGQRTVQDVIDNELKAFPLSLGSFSISQADSSAIATVWGLSKAKAIYTKGWGWTLVRGMDETEFRKKRKPMYINRPSLSDTLEWPIGSMVTRSSDTSVDHMALNKVLEEAFNENVPDKILTFQA